MALAHSPKIVSEDLIFVLDGANTKSYTGTGLVWKDVSGNENNGAIVGNSHVVHETGSHLRFNEGNTGGTGYVEMGTVLGTSYTKNIWFRTNAAGTNNLMSGSSSAGGTVLWANGGEQTIFAGHNGSWSQVSWNSGSSTGLRTWHNACVTYSSTTLKLYVNGILRSTGTSTDPTDLTLHIAGYANQFELTGDVAYTSLYSRALTAEEVLQNYNAIKNRSTFTSNAANSSTIATVTPAASSVNEGSSLAINVATEFLAVNTGTLYYSINQNASDFGTSSGTFNITNNTGSFNVTPTADATTEGSETFTVNVRTGSTTGTIIGTSSTITINDTSLTPTYSASSSSSSVNEGSSVTISVTTTNISNGTTLYWRNSKANTSDFSSSNWYGSFTINSNSGSFNVTARADSTTEGSETFYIMIKTGSTSGTTVAQTSNITINDTSTGKIVCTTLNQMYGFGSFRNKIWMKYNDYENALYPSNSKILELGYHKVFGKLTEMMPTSPLLTKILRRMARVRTDRLKREMSGKPITFESKLYPTIIRPIFYIAGWLVHKGVLKKYDKSI